MAVTYSPAIKAARILATRAQFAGGELEIVAAGGSRLACFRLAPDGGRVEGEAWIMAFNLDEVIAEGSGIPVEARIKTVKGEIGLTGLTVGKGKDIEISYPEKGEAMIRAGQAVRLTSASILHA